MKKMSKKILAFMLAAVMVIGTAPLSGFVGLELPSFADIFGVKAEAATSGTCGDNLTWSFDESSGTLTISGTGAMYDWSLKTKAPWSSLNYTNAVIDSRVTQIGSFAFIDSDLQNITIPNSVTKIGAYSFNNCEITEIFISNNVEIIGDYAFANSNKLDNITLPNTALEIGVGAFQGTGHWDDNDNWQDKLLYVGNHLVYGGTHNGFYLSGARSIKNGTITIANCALKSQGGLTEITLPASLRRIGLAAFSECRALTSITIPNGVLHIGEAAFSNCKKLLNITLPSSLEAIPSRLFEGCSVLESVTLPAGVTVVMDHAFAQCESLTNVVCGTKISVIEYYAFYKCKSLEDIALTSELTDVGTGAFLYCDNLKDVLYFGTVADWCKINFGDSSSNPLSVADKFYINNELVSDLIIPYGVSCIKDYAFVRFGDYEESSDYKGLVSVTIPDSVKSIGQAAFIYCKNLEFVNFGNGVTSIGENAFLGCDSLKNVAFPNSLVTIDESAFNGCVSIESILIPDSVTSIGKNAFQGCTALSEAELGRGITHLDYHVFLNCTNLKSVVWYTEKMVSVSSGTFAGCENLKRVTFFTLNCYWEADTFKDTVTIYGVEGSASERLANKYGLTFLPIDWYVVEFEEENYSFIPKEKIDSSELIKLTWMPKDDDKVFVPEKLLVTISDSSVAVIEKTTYSYIGENVEILIEMKPLTGGECTLSVWYKGAVDTCVVKVEKADIMVYTTQPSLVLDIGEKMGMGFALSKDGKVEEWKNMALVISNPTVVDVSDYIYSEQGYYINFTGKKEGSTIVTVTDSDSGAYVTFLIKVALEDNLCRTYKIDKIPEYYPEIWGCRETKTNFYDVSGLYVNQYKQGALNANGKYPVSFNVFNSNYHYGSVDIYDANGKWIESKCIDKYAMMPKSVLETADQLFYLITDGLSFDWFSYEANHFAKKTEIKIEVPKGGYFTITNNIANSPGTLLYNTADFMSTVLSGSITLVNMNNAVDEVIKDIISDDAVYDAFMSALMNIGVNVANQSLTVGVGTASNALVTDVEGVFESLGLGFNSFCSTAAGIAQDVFTSFDTPFGKALELCFKISELSNTTCQMLNLLNSDDNVYLAIHTNESAQNHVMNGVVVDDSGNVIDREAVLQVFRVTDVSMSDIEISTDSELKFDDYITYNICFVKNETEVQPNGKVQVKIPIPEGMDKKSCCVLREEKNGKWTVLTARVDGNYLVFETDHFSLYAVAGNYADSLKVDSMPAKLEYKFGDIIDTKGMSIVVTYDDGRTETITEGFICTPARLAEGGTQEITVSYGNTTTTFTVEVDSNIKFSAAVATPSTTTIKYGDSIILHADVTGTLPAGATIQWSTDNGNFEKVAANDGMTCKITPKSSGDTTITMKVVSADGEVIAEDTQIMTSKAGLFDKIIGFFKKLFGLTKTIPQAFKRIF